MKGVRGLRKKAWLGAATVVAAMGALPSLAAQAPKGVPAKNVVTKQERMDRAVDEMAASSRETAILNLRRMLRLKRGTPEEPMILWRLADIEWRSSKSYFRVGVSKGVDLDKTNNRFTELLQSCIAHTSEILTRFPKFPHIREVLVRRGRAYEELKQKDHALRDYLDYISRYPDERPTVEVRLMASDVLAEKERHQDIINILKPVDVSQDLGGLEGQVAEKQALANFHVENYPEAIRKAEWLLRYDRARGLNKDTGGHYDEVIGMVALFYGTAFEKRLAGYSLEHAMDYFRRLEGGTIFGKLSHEFMLVMRSKEMQQETIAWKDLALKKMPKSLDTLWVLVDAYDAIINWKDFQQFAGIERDFGLYFSLNPGALEKVQELPWYAKFKRTLLEFADKIYATLPKEPNENDFRVIQGSYLQALNAHMRITDPKDEIKAKVRFRIGEFYSNVKDWDKAQQAFTEVYQAKLFVVTSPELRDQARLRAMTARYDAFKEKGIIPQSLKAAKLNSPKRRLPPDVVEWIKWVDEVAAQKTSQPETMDKLLFEANRVVYSHGDVEAAYKRMLHYVGTRPNAKMTPAVCALVIDTLIESEAWVATRTLAIKFQEMPNVAVGEFKKKLYELERDSHYKIIANVFKTKDYPKAKAFGEEHLKLYPDSRHKVDVIAMLGKTSMELKDTESSLAYMNQVIDLSPNHDSAGVAFFVRATDSEKRFNFRQAFDDYYRVLKLPADKRGISANDVPALKKKLFMLGLVTDDAKVLETLSKSPDFCGGRSQELRAECERLSALSIVRSDSDKRAAWAFVELGDKAPQDTRAAWYAVALSRGHQIPNSVIAKTVDGLMKSFDRLDSMSQVEVLSGLQVSVPTLYRKKLEVVERNSPISKRLDDLQHTLQKRVREVQGLEKLAASLLSLPSAEIKVEVLGVLAGGYRKIADQLDAMPVPKGFAEEEASVFKQAITSMVGPLRQKVDQLGKQSWEISKQSGIPTPWWDAANENDYGPAFAKEKIQWDPAAAYLAGVSAEGKKSPWFEALVRKRVRSAIFFHQLSQTPQGEKLELSESDAALMQFATLRSLGLGAEANHLIQERLPTLKGEALRLAMVTRVHGAVVSRSPEGVRSTRGEFREKRLRESNREESRILAVAESADRVTSGLIARAEAAAREQAQALANAKANEAKAQERAPAAAKGNSPGVDSVPGASAAKQ